MNKTRRFRLSLLAATVAAFGLSGYTITSSRIYWSYFVSPDSNLVGSQTATGIYDSTGLPTYPANVFSKTSFTAVGLNVGNFPDTLLSRIAQSLPEAKNIAANTLYKDMVDQSTSDDRTNIIIKDNDADAGVTFVSEGAGYLNSVGYFIYDPNNPPTNPNDVTNAKMLNEQIIFPNATMNTPLPIASTAGAATVHLGKIPKGMALGFFVVANGWSASGRTKPSTMAGANEKIGTNAIYYSLMNLNPEPLSSNKRQHTILLNEATVNGTDGLKYQRFILGFEDLLRTSTGCDHDFNDVLLAVHISPSASVSNLSQIPTVAASDAATKDTDNDGVKDTLDEFPNDPTAASSRYPLGQGNEATLAFEDNWPVMGDYDLNDVVMRYTSQEILNASGQVTRVVLTYRLMARGGSDASGFGVMLPNIAGSKIDKANSTFTVNSVKQASVPLVAQDGNDATFKLFDTAETYMPKNTSASGSCAVYSNTVNGCSTVAASTFVLDIKLTEAFATSAFPAAPYNPFTFLTKATGREVHLPGQKPSAAADKSLFGTGDDGGVTGASTPYTTRGGNLPWALHIASAWKYPTEFTNVVGPYASIVPWAQSKGVNNTDWYVKPTDTGKLFVSP
jgi:LruC domain-containing protein